MCVHVSYVLVCKYLRILFQNTRLQIDCDFQMPRNRTRTTDKASWTEDQLTAALAAIRDGEKIRAIGRRFGIHEATLRKRLKLGLVGGPSMGRKAVFTKAQETEIASHLLLLAKLFYGVTLTELRRIAFEFADKNNIKHNFNEATKLAGKDWAQGFMRRNPQLSLRKPEATSINRILSFNKNEISHFYDNLKSVMDKYNFPPSRIFNVDETGITTVQRPPAIIGPKGQKQVGSATSLERGKNITLCCAMSATGIFIPPMFIFPGKRASSGIKHGGPAGSSYKMSESGWMNEELFYQWLQHFVSHTQSSKETPTLLLMDNHSSHTSLLTYNYCKDNGIIVVSFPPHTSHRLQPLDLTFFGPLKTAYNRECSLFLKQHGFQRISKEDVPILLKSAYEKVAGVSKAVSGFSKPGIFPFNDDVFGDEDFLPSEIGSATTDNVVSATRPDQNELTQPASILTAVPSTSSTVSITDISPIPKPCTSASSLNNTRQRKKQRSEILTATPRKLILEEMEEKRKKKLQDKKTIPINKKLKLKSKKVKKSLFSIPADSDDEDNPADICQDDDIDDDCDLSSMLAVSNNTNDTCMFCGEFGKDKELWFRCGVCSGWVHSDCSAAESHHNFVCDHCLTE